MKSPKQKTEDEIKELEAAKAQARESAEKNRNLLFGSLLIFVFLILVVLQTTDVDLLLGKAIKLPVIDVDIPLFAFYLLSSPLAFLVHLNLLRNIEAHAVKLQAWQDIDKTLKAADLFPFIFDFAAIDRESSLAGLTRWFSQLVIYWLGALTLLLIFWRFTDYQNSGITVLHFGFLVIDLIVLRITRQKILDILPNNESENADKTKTLSVWEAFERYLSLALGGWACARNGKGELLGQITGFLIVFTSYMHLFLFFSYTFPLFHRYDFPNRLNNIAHENVLFLGSTLIYITSLFQPILTIDQQENLLALNESLLNLQHKLSSNPNEKFGLWFMEHGVGIDLRNRNLRYAQLQNADLRRSKLTKADLFYADLSRAKLQGADLRDAKLQHAALWKAELQRTNLLQAELQHTNLLQAELQKADFKWANLQGADLRQANLQGAKFWLAELQGADLIAAKLQGADLRHANLQGADLITVKLQGADLQDAVLTHAKLQGADLRDTKLKDADLRITDLQGADLRGVDFKDVDLNETTLRDVFTDESLLVTESNYSRGEKLRRVVDNRVSTYRLIKTLTKTLCDMDTDTDTDTDKHKDRQKYILEGIIRNYGPSKSNSDLLASNSGPTRQMQIVHDHFKKLKAPLDC